MAHSKGIIMERGRRGYSEGVAIYDSISSNNQQDPVFY
jgi:hypothetical protein